MEGRSASKDERMVGEFDTIVRGEEDMVVIFYRVGGKGDSGNNHLLEHLLYKTTNLRQELTEQ